MSVNIDKIIERECPRYIKRTQEYLGVYQQVILDTHSGKSHIPVKNAPLEDKDFDEVLDAMNMEYEVYLRNHFARRGNYEFQIS